MFKILHNNKEYEFKTQIELLEFINKNKPEIVHISNTSQYKIDGSFIDDLNLDISKFKT